VKKLLLLAVAAVVVVVGGVVVYVQFIRSDAPAAFTLDAAPTTAAGAAAGSSPTAAPTTAGGPVVIDGTWKVGSGSQVGYRVQEDFIGGLQNATAVGRTDKVTGSLTVAGATIPTATFTADLTGLKSDDNRRDGQVQGRILQTAQFPTATFTLTKPIALAAAPVADKDLAGQATGDLKLHGVTKSVTFPVQAKVTGATATIVGSIPIVFADYGISNPSNAIVSTKDNGLLEFRLVMTK